MRGGICATRSRLLRRTPVFALTASLSLAIGIGATTTIFTVANALLLRAPAGVADPDRLVDIYNVEERQSVRGPRRALLGLSRHPSDVRRRSRASTPTSSTFSRSACRVTGAAERVFSNVVTPNYFAVLGVPAAVGRVFTADRR